MAAVVLLVKIRTIAAYATVAAEPAANDVQLRELGSTLMRSAGGTLILVVVLVLDVYESQGLTPPSSRSGPTGAGRSPP